MNNQNFDLSDNLNLKTFSYDKESVNSNEDIIRNLKDENGRLMKLLQEKDFEIKKLKRDNEKPIISRDVGNLDKSVLSEGMASMKIMELSKKLRENAAELESFKSKYFQKVKENKNLENEMIQLKSNNPISQSTQPTNETFEEMKTLKEKLKTSDAKVLDLLTNNQNLLKDYKISMKILEDEIGDPNVDVNKLLNNPSGWKGRAQKIMGLTQKVDKLTKQLKEIQENDSHSFSSFGRDISSGATSIGTDKAERRPAANNFVTSGDRQSEVLARMQRERQLSSQKMEQDYNKQTEELAKLKQNCEGLKCRNQSLTNDIKSHKQQIRNMLDKAKNDDELIASLILRQDQLKMTIQSMMRGNQDVQITNTHSQIQAATQSYQDMSTIDKLREIVAMKENEIQDLRAQKLSGNGQQNEDCKDSSNMDHQQLKITSASLEVEIKELRRMVQLSDARYQALVDKNTRLAEETSQFKQICLQLEREVQKLYPNSKFKSKFKPIADTIEQSSDAHLTALLSADAPVTKEIIMELQEAVSLRIDKIDSLNNALELMSSAKQEDIKILTEIIDQTRSKFVESIKKLKSNIN